MPEVLHIKDRNFKLYLRKNEIISAIGRIANAINKEFAEKNPVFVVILNGAFMFAADLLKMVSIPCEVSFVKLKSYEGISSSGRIKDLIGLEGEFQNRYIIVVEDIVDSGNTIVQLLTQIQKHDPKRIAISTLLFKPDSMEHDVDIDYVGFKIPNAFVVGYGLDYDGYGRNLEDIYQVS